MRKSTLFVSAALTAFMLAVLAGVVSTYRNITSATAGEAAQVQSPAMVEVVSDPTQVASPVPTQAVYITPEEAASIASAVIGRTDVYSVEIVQLNGADVYLVTFSSGDLVYVSLDGQIISISKLPVTVVSQQQSGGGRRGRGNGGNTDDDDHRGGDD